MEKRNVGTIWGKIPKQDLISARDVTIEVPAGRECVSHTVYLAHGDSKGEARGRSRHKRNSNGVVRNLEERNVGTKGKNPKQGLISAKDLPIELTEGYESPYHRLH